MSSPFDPCLFPYSPSMVIICPPEVSAGWFVKEDCSSLRTTLLTILSNEEFLHLPSFTFLSNGNEHFLISIQTFG